MSYTSHFIPSPWSVSSFSMMSVGTRDDVGAAVGARASTNCKGDRMGTKSKTDAALLLATDAIGGDIECLSVRRAVER